MLLYLKTVFVGVSLLALSAGCGSEEVVVESSLERLDAVAHANRTSMALRGIRPSINEYEEVRGDGDALGSMVDDWMDSPEFGEMIKDLHAELYLLRDDIQFQLPVHGPLEEKGYSKGDMHHSTVEAPLEMIREIVLDDRPYTEILTSPTTVANEVVATTYGLNFDPDGPEWQHTTWSDGRPQSGLLSDSQIWRRHVSNAQNFHRGRANFVSRAFLCEDIGSRDVFVDGGVNIADPEEVAEAVGGQEGCIGCHNVLDPLAAFFWGYKEQLLSGAINAAYGNNCEWDWANGAPPRGSYRVEHWCYPLKFWDVTDEQGWDLMGLPQPSYFGQPAKDVTELGPLIGEDPRFSACTARTFAGYLTQTSRKELPVEWVNELQATFEESGFSAKALVKAIVLSDQFAAARVVEGEMFTAGLQSIRPEQLHRLITDLTGFEWLANMDAPSCDVGINNCWGDVKVLTSDVFGLRSMMGGIDGKTVTFPANAPTPLRMLGMRRLAADAAGFVVERDLVFVSDDERLLLTDVNETDTDEAIVRSQISALHLRFFGESLDSNGDEVSLTYNLWASTFDRTQSTLDAWKVVVAALLRDPQMALY